MSLTIELAVAQKDRNIVSIVRMSPIGFASTAGKGKGAVPVVALEEKVDALPWYATVLRDSGSKPPLD